MGTGLICAGFILLFNPVINVFDVVPDAIGYLLIFAGLTRLSYFYERADAARRFFGWLALIGLAKIGSVALVVTPVESGSMKLLLTFVFSIAEAAMFAPAVVWLFEGYQSAALKLGSDRSNTVTTKKGKTVDTTVRARNYMIFFMIFRCAATLVPELTELEMYDRVGNVSNLSMPLTYYKKMFYIIFSALTLIFGVIYIVTVSRFFSSTRKDKTMNEAFAAQYEKAKAEREGFFISVRMKTGLLLFTLSVIALIPLYFDSVNIMIGVIFAGLVISSAVAMKKDVPHVLTLVPLSAVTAALSVLSFIMQVNFFNGGKTEDVLHFADSAEKYNAMSLVCAAENLLAAATVITAVALVLRAVPAQQKKCGISDSSAQYSKARHDAETFGYIKTKLISSAVITVLSLGAKTAYRFIAPTTPAFIVAAVGIAIFAAAYTAFSVAGINTEFYDKEH